MVPPFPSFLLCYPFFRVATIHPPPSLPQKCLASRGEANAIVAGIRCAPAAVAVVLAISSGGADEVKQGALVAFSLTYVGQGVWRCSYASQLRLRGHARIRTKRHLSDLRPALRELDGRAVPLEELPPGPRLILEALACPRPILHVVVLVAGGALYVPKPIGL